MMKTIPQMTIRKPRFRSARFSFLTTNLTPNTSSSAAAIMVITTADEAMFPKTGAPFTAF